MKKIVQDNFIKFHDAIRVDIEENKELVKKREMLLDELRDFLRKKSETEGSKLITFSTFNQGSYPMGTGNKPAFDDQDYDIDVAIVFNICKDDYTPLEVKGWLLAAWSKLARTVEWKKPCIRVQYVEKGLPRFHIDFACYSSSEFNVDRKTYLAKGKPTISREQNRWEVSEPKKLKEVVLTRFTDQTEDKQFKRVLRYYKRWKDNKFTSVYGKPTGISLTALALSGFVPHTKNFFSNAEEIDDHKALIRFTDYIINNFNILTRRISVYLPVPPYNDLFEKMSDDQCSFFKDKLKKLKNSLEEAYSEPDPHKACKILQQELGDDFPVPSKEETAQVKSKAMVGTSESA